ncbi:MAG: MFS transporter [Acidimicrobiia bacterium]
MTTGPDATRPRLVTGSFAVITLAALAYFTAIGMSLPTLPRMVEDDLSGGGLAVGVTAGALAVTAALLRPWVGRTGDRSGRQVLVVGGGTVAAVALLGHGLAADVPQLVLARLVMGGGEAMFFVGAATAVQDLAPDARRGEAASYFSVAIWGGTGIGPFLAEVLRDAHGTDAVWWTAAALCAIGALLGLAVPPGGSGQAPTSTRLVHPAALAPGVVLLLAVTGLGAFQTFVALHVDDLGMHDAAGVFLLYSAVVLVVRVAGARAADVFGGRRVAGAGIALGAVGLALIALATTPAGLYAGTAVMALGLAPVYPALFSLVIGATPDNERTAAVATFTLFFDLSQGLGLPLLGLVAALGGERAAFGAGAVVEVAGVLLLRAVLRDPGRAVPAG